MMLSLRYCCWQMMFLQLIVLILVDDGICEDAPGINSGNEAKEVNSRRVTK